MKNPYYLKYDKYIKVSKYSKKKFDGATHLVDFKDFNPANCDYKTAWIIMEKFITKKGSTAIKLENENTIDCNHCGFEFKEIQCKQ